MPAPTMTGVDSRNENLAAHVRVLSRNSAVVMVMPLRETPGTSAMAWLEPIDIESVHVYLSMVRVCLLFSPQ